MKLPFGKYKGFDICFINSGYLKWLIEQEWFFMPKKNEEIVVAVEKEYEWRENTKVKNQPPDLTAGEFNRSE